MRCYICDFSESGYNDHVSLDISNKVVYDERVDKYVCHQCLHHVWETVDEFEDEDLIDDTDDNED